MEVERFMLSTFYPRIELNANRLCIMINVALVGATRCALNERNLTDPADIRNRLSVRNIELEP